MRLQTLIRKCIDPLVPRQYWMAYDFAVDRWMGRLEEEIFMLERLPTERKTAIDVGANKGHYTYKMSKLFENVIAFEPNRLVTARMERTKPSNVKVENVALSDSPSVATLYIPIVDGRELYGWASFDRKNMPGATELRSVEVEVRPLDAFSIDGVSLMKIDVEGHELQVLAGATETIERCRPVVLVEIKKRNRSEAAALFEGLRYRCHALLDGELREVEGGLGSFVGEKENFFFIPEGGS
ncbi:MAG: FkbM family methyltransferase [Planctomycetota bacterium]|nr:FkbM family methyltransferase [Planctomycetota bacterium]